MAWKNARSNGANFLPPSDLKVRWVCRGGDAVEGVGVGVSTWSDDCGAATVDWEWDRIDVCLGCVEG